MIIGLIIGVIVGTYWCLTASYDKLALFVMPVIFSMVGVLVISLPASFIFSDEVTVEHKLVSLKDGSSVSGSFFLGIGGVGEDAEYSFYEQDTDGKFHLEQVDADRASIVEYDGTPKMTESCDDYGDSPWLLTWPISYDSVDCYDRDVVFYVPEGSVKTDFVLDAE